MCHKTRWIRGKKYVCALLSRCSCCQFLISPLPPPICFEAICEPRTFASDVFFLVIVSWCKRAKGLTILQRFSLSIGRLSLARVCWLFWCIWIVLLCSCCFYFLFSLHAVASWNCRILCLCRCCLPCWRWVPLLMLVLLSLLDITGVERSCYAKLKVELLLSCYCFLSTALGCVVSLTLFMFCSGEGSVVFYRLNCGVLSCWPRPSICFGLIVCLC